jgi:hypothetical protein
MFISFYRFIVHYLHYQWKSRWTVTIPVKTRCVLLHYDSSKHYTCPLNKVIYVFKVVKLFLKHPVSRTFFFNFPLYFQSVPVHSANAVRPYTEAGRRVLTSTLLYFIGSESSCDLGSVCWSRHQMALFRTCTYKSFVINFWNQLTY